MTGGVEMATTFKGTSPFNDSRHLVLKCIFHHENQRAEFCKNRSVPVETQRISASEPVILFLDKNPCVPLETRQISASEPAILVCEKNPRVPLETHRISASEPAIIVFAKKPDVPLETRRISE
jgi:myo-inositol-hexaphosphate 3-phosphohydrolase